MSIPERRGHANRATLDVSWKLVAYLMTVDALDSGPRIARSWRSESPGVPFFQKSLRCHTSWYLSCPSAQRNCHTPGPRFRPPASQCRAEGFLCNRGLRQTDEVNCFAAAKPFDPSGDHLSKRALLIAQKVAVKRPIRFVIPSVSMVRSVGFQISCSP